MNSDYSEVLRLRSHEFFAHISRSNSSLSLERHALQELRESSRATPKSRTLSSLSSLSRSNSDLRKREKSLEKQRKEKLRKCFIHFDVESLLAQQILFSNEETTEDDSSDDVSETNQLLSASHNFRNEIGAELVYALHATNKEDVPRRRPTHCPSLARQLSLLSAFDAESDTSQRALLSPTVCPFSRDFSDSCLESDSGATYYRNYFYGRAHHNWVARTDNGRVLALSVRKDPRDLKRLRVILRESSSLGSLKGFLAIQHLPEANPRALFDLLLPRETHEKLRLCNESAHEILLKVDELLETRALKVGVLYARDSQCTEEDFYNNREVRDEDFDSFLRLIGSRIRLKGFKGFKGGLDVATDTTGLFAYYTRHEDREIVYHVCHELPFSANNRQQLLRKRHIGNDIITIVFQSRRFRGKAFNADSIRSHFQHIFLIIRPHADGYRVAVARHRSVPSFGPPVKPFLRKEELRSFLLSKVINGENACHRCSKFKEMALRTRFEYLMDLNTNYITNSSLNTYLSSNNTSQQLLQFSLNFNKYFSQIFPKKKTKDKNEEKTKEKELREENVNSVSIFADNDLFFGAKLYSSDEKCRLFVYSPQERRDLESILIGLSQNFLILIHSKRVKLVIPLKQLLSFHLSFQKEKQLEIQLKLFIHLGENVILSERIQENIVESQAIDAFIEDNSLLFSLKTDIVNHVKTSLSEPSMRVRQMRHVLLKRNTVLGDNSFGFHVQCKRLNGSSRLCVYITEVNEFAQRVNGLRAGQRLLEICSLSVSTLSHDSILELLRTSETVSIGLLNPNSEGMPQTYGCFARLCRLEDDNVSRPDNESTLQQDLRQLLTLEDEEEEEVVSSSSRYSTATSTPYSSLERRRDSREVVTVVAKPAFVVNHVNELGFAMNASEEKKSVNCNSNNNLEEKVKELSKEKLRLNETIRQLKEENQRLHFESQTASQQLRRFTEWFFSSNNNNNNN